LITIEFKHEIGFREERERECACKSHLELLLFFEESSGLVKRLVKVKKFCLPFDVPPKALKERVQRVIDKSKNFCHQRETGSFR
jgi:hypothetical protein